VKSVARTPHSRRSYGSGIPSRDGHGPKWRELAQKSAECRDTQQGPLLPLFDHLITTLVADLEERGLLDDVLVIAMGEFGRTPNMGTQGSTDGRNHWPVVMSMCLAGGGLRHGQIIGASSRDGGEIHERPVTPGDLAATLFRYFDVPLDVSYLDNRGRPRFILDQGGTPIRELIG
jgi:uncharacterized protein (DUF1501 family)